MASSTSAGRRWARGGGGPRRRADVAEAVEPGLEQGGARGEAVDIEQGDQRVAIDRAGHQAAQRLVGQRAVVAAGQQREQPGDRIEPQRAARDGGGADNGQVGESATKNHVGLAGAEAFDRRGGGEAGKVDIVALLGLPVGPGGDPAEVERFLAAADVEGERSAALAVADNREFGLGE